MQFPFHSDFDVMARSKKLVRRSQALLAASRRAVPARWLSPADRPPDDDLSDPLLQIRLLAEQSGR